MNCMICHMEHGTRTGLYECQTCGKAFCVDCGAPEELECCECARDDATAHNQDFHICDRGLDDMLKAVCDDA